MTRRLPERPVISWGEDGTPVADGFGDVYYSRLGGLEEGRAVYLAPCGLPERWANCDRFTIGELGFGTGLNFLTAVEAWLASRRRPDGWLHFLSVEKYPMSKKDAARALAGWPELAPLADRLLANWPARMFGTQRFVFDDWRVSLTLTVEDAGAALEGWQAGVDAWFLDGFAPARNAAMWTPHIFSHMARLSAPGARVGTYTAAGAVRHGLADAGFAVSKETGFSRKRHRLEAVFPDGNTASEPDPFLRRPTRLASISHVRVIGAGIAGASAAHAFARRGFQVEVIDQAGDPANGASGNDMALVMPRLDASDGPVARLARIAYLHALASWGRFSDAAFPVPVHHLPGGDKDRARYADLLDNPPLDETFLRAGEDGGLVYPGALILHPRHLVAALLHHTKITVTTHTAADLARLLEEAPTTGHLTVIASGATLGEQADAQWLGLIARKGQVENGRLERASNVDERRAIASGTYALADGGKLLFGAGFAPMGNGETVASVAADPAMREASLAAIQALSPDLHARLDASSLTSRASVRATTRDRMPIAGVWTDPASYVAETGDALRTGAALQTAPDHRSDLYLLAGLGARGFTFAPLMAEHIAAMALGEPSLLSRNEAEHVSPQRFLVRDLKRRLI